jgi:hypothetical protein
MKANARYRILSLNAGKMMKLGKRLKVERTILRILGGICALLRTSVRMEVASVRETPPLDDRAR